MSRHSKKRVKVVKGTNFQLSPGGVMSSMLTVVSNTVS